MNSGILGEDWRRENIKRSCRGKQHHIDLGAILVFVVLEIRSAMMRTVIK